MTSWPSNQPPVRNVSDEQRRNWKARFQDSDRAAGIEVTEDFEPFNQMNDMFTRAFWDETVRTKDTDAFFSSYRMKTAPRRGDGFTLKDFALRNAAWAVSDMVSARGEGEGKREGFQAAIELLTPVADEQLEIEDSANFTQELKEIAKLFGADLAGVTEHDERWLYSARVDTRDFSESPNELPEDITHVIVLGHSMDRELVDTYPSALAGASTGLEYSHEAAIVIQLASYIRNLGYEAVPSMNDTGLVIPLAVKAGLGEYGRNQMVITPEFGPRLRFSKIFTSLPLTPDQPKRHGVTEYCNICTKCADQCPPKALPFGAPDTTPPNQSTISGVRKWSADCEKCFSYWAKLKSDCAICMRVCPFNRDFSSWTARIWRALATSRYRKLALWWETRFPNGVRLRPKDWWASLAQR
ncbi:reductive dehalogenase [Pelagibius sp. Alg239-R121]|uniref:reductive dehalogenase n=1 Tax=Pelagibius sp. Alg239-R121 TaxID=2993448 RepID=UPI0024A68598|nr:reductive dehalogenase [Pelagibius sp. Alg239-R121]